MRPSHGIALLALLLSDVAHSQSFENIGPGQQEARLSIGIAMPFGGASAHRDAQRQDGPRLELMLTRDYVGATGGTAVHPFASRPSQPGPARGHIG